MMVRELMTTSVSFLKPEDSVKKAIDIMRGENIGFIPICDINGHLLGVLTDRDIILRDGLGKTCGQIMTTNPVTALPTEDIHNVALRLSKKAIRRIPVLENDRLVGVLALGDLAKKKIFKAEIGHIIFNISNMQPSESAHHHE